MTHTCCLDNQVVSVSGETSLRYCQIDCTNYKTSQLTADPLDQHRFYLCKSTTTWQEESFACDTGLDFDVNSYDCMDPHDPSYQPTPLRNAALTARP
ncbi:hypothetical protein Hamer_G016718 [Homarus americanus]|uniref:Chitin-binding type-2 domain-containing protein n=1 Tax=Homarus americanus TaxID=6706 RepID=A0A8J5NBT6_HOMAM|nr:hypothetical protein Hamer_G016718 [Homarus americanus]